MYNNYLGSKNVGVELIPLWTNYNRGLHMLLGVSDAKRRLMLKFRKFPDEHNNNWNAADAQIVWRIYTLTFSLQNAYDIDEALLVREQTCKNETLLYWTLHPPVLAFIFQSSSSQICTCQSRLWTYRFTLSIDCHLFRISQKVDERHQQPWMRLKQVIHKQRTSHKPNH